jgi:hypothetical protein
MKLTVRECPYVCLIVGASLMILPPKKECVEADKRGQVGMDTDG